MLKIFKKWLILGTCSISLLACEGGSPGACNDGSSTGNVVESAELTDLARIEGMRLAGYDGEGQLKLEFLPDDAVVYSEFVIDVGFSYVVAVHSIDQPILTPTWPSWQQIAHNLGSFSLISKAHACSGGNYETAKDNSEAPKVALSKVSSIEIQSDDDFGSGYSSGDNLTDLFDISYYDEMGDLQYQSLSDFLATNSQTPLQFTLHLIQAPMVESLSSFTVSVTLDNGETFRKETQPVLLQGS